MSGQVFLTTEFTKTNFSFHRFLDFCITDKGLWAYIITLIPLIANEKISENMF